ncbi:MAG: S49 family peptidase, partial [Kiloniellales bacterium]|nr:S49 family peptidase [Kiloniellales bacterium]
RKSLELGLVDGLGELRQVMRERYGKKVRLKRVDGERRWWRPSLRIETPRPSDWASGLIAAVEERSLWARYGL